MNTFLRFLYEFLSQFFNGIKYIVLGIFNETRIFADYVQTIVLDRSKAYLAMRQDAPYVAPDVKSITFKEILHIP